MNKNFFHEQQNLNFSQLFFENADELLNENKTVPFILQVKSKFDRNSSLIYVFCKNRNDSSTLIQLKKLTFKVKALFGKYGSLFGYNVVDEYPFIGTQQLYAKRLSQLIAIYSNRHYHHLAIAPDVLFDKC